MSCSECGGDGFFDNERDSCPACNDDLAWCTQCGGEGTVVVFYWEEGPPGTPGTEVPYDEICDVCNGARMYEKT